MWLGAVRVVCKNPALLAFVVAVCFSVAQVIWCRLFGIRRGLRAPVPGLSQSIFVALVCGPGCSPVTLERILARARVPSRVFVGVYDDGDVVMVREAWQNQVRVARFMGRAHSFHRPSARAWVLSRLSRGERFTLLVPSSVELASGWDDTLVDMLGTHPEGSVLTTMCVSKADSSFVQKAAPVFLCAQSIRGTRLRLEGRRAAQVPSAGELVPSLFWCPSFSFCESWVLEKSGFVQWAGSVHSSSESVAVGVALWTRGSSFYVPWRELSWVEAPDDSSDSRKSRHPVDKRVTCTYGDARSVGEYEAFTGISFAKDEVTPRACAGLTPSAQVSECVCKYGSLEQARLVVRPRPGSGPSARSRSRRNG